MKETTNHTFSLRSEVYDFVKKQAKQYGLSQSAYLSAVIKEHMKRVKKGEALW